MDAAQGARRSLGELFVERGLISETDLEKALAEQFATKQRLADILVRRGLVSGRDITEALNEQLASFRAPETPAENGPPAQLVEAIGHDEPAETHVPEPPLTLHPADQSPTAPVEDVPVTETQSSEEAGHTFSWHDPATPEADHEVATVPDVPVAAVEPDILIREADARRETMESRLSALGPILEGLDRIHSELKAHELTTPLLSHELNATQERLIARGDALSAEIAELKELRDRIETTASTLETLRTELATKIHELSELRATAAIWTSRVDDLEAEVEALTARTNASARELDTLAASRPATPGTDAATKTHMPEGHTDGAPVDAAGTAEGHVLFVPTEDGYELVEANGSAPRAGEIVNVGEQTWMVTKVGQSPLPFDDRECAFLTSPG